MSNLAREYLQYVDRATQHYQETSDALEQFRSRVEENDDLLEGMGFDDFERQLQLLNENLQTEKKYHELRSSQLEVKVKELTDLLDQGSGEVGNEEEERLVGEIRGNLAEVQKALSSMDVKAEKNDSAHKIRMMIFMIMERKLEYNFARELDILDTREEEARKAGDKETVELAQSQKYDADERILLKKIKLYKQPVKFLDSLLKQEKRQPRFKMLKEERMDYMEMIHCYRRDVLHLRNDRYMLYDIPEELHRRNRAKEKSVVMGVVGLVFVVFVFGGFKLLSWAIQFFEFFGMAGG